MFIGIGISKVQNKIVFFRELLRLNVIAVSIDMNTLENKT